MSEVSKRVAFLDRDGTINQDQGYTYKLNDFKFVTGVIPFLQKLKDRGYNFVIVTNQAGVAKRKFSLSESYAFSNKVKLELEQYGIEIKSILTCPHHPDGTDPLFSKVCTCRKPNGGLILRYILNNSIDYEHSLIVGNKISDMKAGISAGLQNGLLVGRDENEIEIKNFLKFIERQKISFNFDNCEEYSQWRK